MEHSILLNFLSSLQLLFVGFIPAAVAGILLGSAIGINPLLYQLCKRLLQIPYSIPPIAFVPLAFIFFKEVEVAASIVVFFSAIWAVIINTATGMRKSRLQDNNFRVAINYIFDALRTGLWIAWFTVIAIEMLTIGRGLGFLIWNGYRGGNYNKIIEGLIYIGTIGFLLDQLLDITGNLLAKIVSEGQKSDD
ncbi:nitrate transporter [Fischerella thermalis]|jgi:ABC-type nitrate/sulfonate/bicarbonate transport system permease component|uniref:ABC-type transporter, integral membrane subunit n=4 Tax=Fischerella TaxID=1190 RepID=G6FP26_9CYAN|nr:nitrate transporter [Fischerella thermalis]ACN96077.1 nitrate transport protein [Fischerella sp. MV11]PLZ95233.1 nitrate transporter [Fischerella thermalis CCMEE 5328]PMB10274.1 nitrate transporter [Fischerella thermalis CCMEE 5273]PMB21187.1 nitrate transporter [Fischerella thermalis CCMEE 5319]EHC18626.1 ABC-type transporter, integral membrane subunit [Fischerella thermalis JSC-11]